MTLGVCIVFPLFSIIFSKAGKLVRKYSQQMQSYLGQMTHDLTEGVMGQKVIKAFNLQDYVEKI